jgi:hypothetical protein
MMGQPKRCITTFYKHPDSIEQSKNINMFFILLSRRDGKDKNIPASHDAGIETNLSTIHCVF